MASIFDDLAQFEQDHPDLAEALRLFDTTLEQYRRALEAMQPGQVFTSNSTTTTRSPLGYTSNSMTVLPRQGAKTLISQVEKE